MDLLEYQGKQLFAEHGVPVPEGRHATTAEEARVAAEELGFPVVIKAQVQIGGRGKAGGIKLAKDADEAEAHAEAILGMDIRGLTVHEIWVEKASDIAAEYYAAVVFDRSAKKPLVMLSAAGGMEIEEVAEEKIARLHVDPLVGFLPFHGRRLAFESGIDADVIRPVGAMLAKLYDVFVATDAMLVEVNPLIVTGDRQVVALDAKVTVDDNALLRQPEVAEMRNPSAEDPQEQMAKERGITYVKLDGEVGILGNGAGLVMSTLDVVAQAGGRPANFLDVGGGAKAEEIVAALEVLLSDPKVKAVLFNIFGGITRCDEVANGILQALEQIDVRVPIVVRLDGTNDEEGRRILAEADAPQLHPAKTMLEAAEMVVGAGEGRSRGVGWPSSSTRTPSSRSQGLTGAQGQFHGKRNREYGTDLVAGVTPGKEGEQVEGVPVFDTMHEAVAETGANTAMVFVPPPFAADAIYEAADAGIEHDHLHHRGHPRARHAAGLQPPAGHRLAPDRAELPRRAVTGQGERRHHPGRLLLPGRRRARVALGHAHVPDRLRAGPARRRELDDRRHRRRPDHRVLLHRRDRALRAGPRDRADRDGRRDRRRRGGAHRRVHRRARVEAGGRLHRGLPGAARQAHGPRRRDHLRLVRHRAGARPRRWRRRAFPLGRNPTEAAQIAAERVGAKA